MKKTDFDRLLERYLTGKVSEEERVKLEAWLEVNKTSNIDDLELTPEAEQRLFDHIMGNQDGSPALPKRKRPLLPLWFASLALTIAVVATTYIFRHPLGQWVHSRTVGAAEMSKVILNDGTIVWLRGESSIAYYEKEAEGIRYADLKGEALFEVAKDPAHPFVLRCGDARVNVLGTSFRIKGTADSVELKVLTGKVSLTVQDQYITEVNALEQVTFARGQFRERRLNTEEATRAVENTEYSMAFENVPLEEIAGRIARKFDVTVTIEEARAKRCRITADFTDHGLDETLQVITEVLDIEFVRNNKGITLRGPGCP